MNYLSAIIYTSMIPDFNKLVNGSSLSLPAHGRAGARAIPFLAVLFAKQKTKFGGGGKARAGREFISPTPLFLPAPPERKLSKVGVRIFLEKSSDFVQDRQPKIKSLQRRFYFMARYVYINGQVILLLFFKN